MTATQRLVIVAVELGVRKCFGLPFDKRVEIVGLFQIDIILPVFLVLGEKLAADRLVDLEKHRFDIRLQVLVRLAAHFGDHRFEQAEAITQFLRRLRPWPHKCRLLSGGAATIHE